MSRSHLKPRKAKPPVEVAYVRIAAPDRDFTHVVMLLLQKIAKVYEFGFGTAKDPNSAWFEVKFPDGFDGRAFMTKEFTLKEYLVTERGEGKLLARQLDLLGGVG